MRLFFAATAFVAFVSVACASGPISGLMVDEQTRSIRPIITTDEDTAYAGRAAVQSFDFASTAPDGRNALVTRDKTLYIIRRLDGSLPVWRELSSEEVKVARAAWSDNSESLALINSDANRLDLWSTVATDPKRSGFVDLTSISERIVSLAVGRDARFAFAATQGKESGTLYLLKPGQEPRMLMPLSKAGVIQLIGDALYIADRGRSEVIRLTNWDQTPGVTTLASAGQGLVDPVGFALSPDKKMLSVASAGTRQVIAIDLNSGAIKATLDLDFAPTTFDRLGQSTLFLLAKAGPNSRPAQVLDAGTQKLMPVSVTAIAAAE